MSASSSQVAILLVVLLSSAGVAHADRGDRLPGYCCAEDAEFDGHHPVPSPVGPEAPPVRPDPPSPDPLNPTPLVDVTWATIALISLLAFALGWWFGWFMSPSLPGKDAAKAAATAAALPTIAEADIRKENYAWLALQKQRDDIVSALNKLWP